MIAGDLRTDLSAGPTRIAFRPIMSPLRRYLPRSLLGRSLLIIGLPIVAVQFISIWFFYDRHVQSISRRMALNLAQSIQLSVNHLRDYKSPKDLVWITSELQSSQGMRVWFRKGETLEGKTNKNIGGLIGREVLQTFRQILNAEFVVDGDHDPRHIRIQVAVPGGVLDIITTKKKIRTITTELYVAWSIGASIVLLLIAALFMRNQVRPIRELAAAADQFGKGRDVPDFKPWGAREVRQAATAFMIMRERIRRQIGQRTEMLAGISHDLRTPITRLKLALAMIKEGPDIPGAEIEALRQDVTEMEHMIEEYLAFARGEGTEQAVEANLNSLIEDVVKKAIDDGIDIDLALPKTLKATVRPNRFKRALSNIVRNAGRFAGQIQVRAHRRAGLILVTIDDNGPGIPEDARDDAFKAFHRLDHARNQDSGGAGLGLTIARDIVRGHGGDVILSDSPLGGLRAVMRFPV